MATRATTEEKLARLRELAANSLDDEAVKEIKKALSSANNVVVAKAARIVADNALTELIPQLVKAFDRFMKKAEKTDTRCLGKIAIIEALDDLEYRESEIFRRGIRHVQLEPVYGGREDTAAALRARSALGFVRLEVPDVFFDLVPLLTDPEPEPRIAAAKALTYLNEEKSELLLRLKVLTGDEEPQVLSECLAGLMSIAPERSMPFVAGFLSSPDPLLVEGAALALGESRKPQAFTLLQEQWEESLDREFKSMLLLPIALTRCDEAFKFLLDVVACEYQDYAVAAVKALKVYADNDSQREKIREAAASRSERPIAEAYAYEFGDESDPEN